MELADDARVHRGNSAILRLSGQSARLPARCQLRLQITHLNSGRREECALRLAEGVPLELDTSHCGVLRCEMTSGWVYDYLGLFRLPRETACRPGADRAADPRAAGSSSKMDGLEYKRWKPKPGGGFAELHELRDYRPGDPLNSVHWKLSAKTDNLIVREAMEPIRRLILVSFDLTQTRLDETLDQLCWLCERLLQQDVVHELRWLEPASGELHSVTIECREDFDAVLEQLLRTKLQRNSPSLRDRVFRKQTGGIILNEAERSLAYVHPPQHPVILVLCVAPDRIGAKLRGNYLCTPRADRIAGHRLDRVHCGNRFDVLAVPSKTPCHWPGFHCHGLCFGAMAVA